MHSFGNSHVIGENISLKPVKSIVFGKLQKWGKMEPGIRDKTICSRTHDVAECYPLLIFAKIMKSIILSETYHFN